MARSRQQHTLELRQLLDTVLTMAQACGRLEVSEATLRRLVAAGQLERRRFGNVDLYSAAEVAKLARARSVGLMEEDATTR